MQRIMRLRGVLLLFLLAYVSAVGQDQFIIGGAWLKYTHCSYLDSTTTMLSGTEWSNIRDVGLNTGIVGVLGNTASASLFSAAASAPEVGIIFYYFKDTLHGDGHGPLDRRLNGNRWVFQCEYAAHFDTVATASRMTAAGAEQDADDGNSANCVGLRVGTTTPGAVIRGWK